MKTGANRQIKTLRAHRKGLKQDQKAARAAGDTQTKKNIKTESKLAKNEIKQTKNAKRHANAKTETDKRITKLRAANLAAKKDQIAANARGDNKTKAKIKTERKAIKGQIKQNRAQKQLTKKQSNQSKSSE